MTTNATLASRREILFLYDIRMGNPNGDPDENRPRVLPEGIYYVTDVRLKRFARDHIIQTQGPEKILVGSIDGKTTNLTGRVVHHLKACDKASAKGKELVAILLDDFIDARWFGSTLAFKKENKLDPEPKTLTGAVQFNMGEVLHRAHEERISGTSIFSSSEEKKAGTFTDTAVLRYALIGFNGVANQHSAKLSGMTDADYDTLLQTLWRGVRSAGNTRSKVGQVPRLLVSIEYQPGQEFQIGDLLSKIKPVAVDGKPEEHWASPQDYRLDISTLLSRLASHRDKVDRVRYELSPDLRFCDPGIPGEWKMLAID